eukprot:3937363-Rhodomonas_salina.3
MCSPHAFVGVCGVSEVRPLVPPNCPVTSCTLPVLPHANCLHCPQTVTRPWTGWTGSLCRASVAWLLDVRPTLSCPNRTPQVSRYLGWVAWAG